MDDIVYKRAANGHPEQLNIDNWLSGIAQGRTDQEMSVIRDACEMARVAHANQVRASGDPYIQHSLAVAGILSGLHLDYETIAAAILHDVIEDSEIPLAEIREKFGENIANLVDGVTKMKTIQIFQGADEKNKKEREQAENLRRMLLAMAEDIRVVLIKLADRTHNMRTLSFLPREKQLRIAKETLDIYAPLANRLGIWQLKWELEDLSFRYLNPETYLSIAGKLDERRSDREQYIASFIGKLDHELKKAGIDAEISGRPKHIYSIWRKMDRKKLDYQHIHDVRGIRILVNSIRDCYAVLGIVHSLWQYITGEFDDYIATPKENNYQSIHTAVIGPDGKTIEVQIRTHEMHKQNELGVAAHWRYKEGSTHDSNFDDKISWLRQLMEWKDEVLDASDFVARLKTDVFEDRVYVFTPQGKVVDLPTGSTPLDFAYHIHTEVGHRCRGAKVNGHIVPLTYQLKSGEQVEILTVKTPRPSRDWVNTDLGYLKTSRARSKVQHWFKQQDYTKNAVDGRENLEREMRRMGLSAINYEKLADKLKFKSTDDLFVAIARNEIKSSQYLNAAQDIIEPARGDRESSFQTQKPVIKDNVVNGMQVAGVGNLLTHMAQCCKPVPGDEIAGYITRGRGITIHRQNCPNMLRYSNHCPERVIRIDWGKRLDHAYPVEIQITAFDRQGLLRDITSILANDQVNLIAANTLSEKDGPIARMNLTLEIRDIDMLSRVLAKISQLPNVMEAKRNNK
jgi:GTP pyrophosphokinase